MKKILVFILVIFVTSSGFSQKEVPFTLDDRDRLIRLETEQKALKSEMNTKFESQQQQINDLKQFFYWGFGIVIALIITLFGYIIWDRRTALYPLMKKVYSLENNLNDVNNKMVEVDKIKAALKEMGESDQKIAEILRRVAMF